MGQKVLSIIVDGIKLAKYFSISADLTSDRALVDQLTILISYFSNKGPIERFLRFIPIFAHTGAEMAEIALQFFDVHKINIEDCRSQSYDNADKMSGKFRGFQTLAREKCRAAHSVLLQRIFSI